MKQTILAAFAALAASATIANAAQLRFDVLEARFYDPVGGSVQSIDNTFGDPISIRWGTSGSQSGYDFDAADTPFSEDPFTVFALGDFTHFNQPITAGTSITGVNMDVRGSLTIVDDFIGETLIGERTFSFGIAHDETTNRSPCADNPDGTPSISVCDDFVNISTLSGSDTFFVDGVEYTLNILGFSQTLADAEAGIFSPFFGSPEGGNNVRVLAATFDESLPPPPPPVVPLPAAAWFLLGGLGSLGALRKFGSKKA